MMMRLNQYLAHCGLASRRDCEELIRAGVVKVNGEVVTALSVRVDPAQDQVQVRNQAMRPPEQDITIAVHKPCGVTCSLADRHADRLITELLPADLRARRLFPVGRLDRDTSGLIIMTTDGQLAQQLAHPAHEVEKEYRVTVTGSVNRQHREQLEQGLDLEDGRTAPARVTDLHSTPAGSVFSLTIHEGRKRIIRRMCAAINRPVESLHRVRIGALRLGDLPCSGWRYLTPAEIERLKRSAPGPG
jgi:23S rRNA pseudouridine2605 synthase